MRLIVIETVYLKVTITSASFAGFLVIDLSHQTEIWLDGLYKALIWSICCSIIVRQRMRFIALELLCICVCCGSCKSRLAVINIIRKKLCIDGGSK